jgi:hypothetical protein
MLLYKYLCNRGLRETLVRCAVGAADGPGSSGTHIITHRTAHTVHRTSGEIAELDSGYSTFSNSAPLPRAPTTTPSSTVNPIT